MMHNYNEVTVKFPRRRKEPCAKCAAPTWTNALRYLTPSVKVCAKCLREAKNMRFLP